MGGVHGGMGGEVVHVVEVGLEEGGEGKLDGVEVAEEGGAELDEVPVQDREEAVPEGRGHCILVEVAEIPQNQLEHLVGVDLLEVVFANQGDLERKGGYFQLITLVFFELTGLYVALDDDIDKLLKLAGDET